MNTNAPVAWPIVIFAAVGVAIAPLSAWLFPGFILAQCGLGVLSAVCAWWGWQAVAEERRHRQELGKARWFTMRIDALRTAAPAGKLYLGTGARLQLRHAKAIYQLAGMNRDAIPQDERPKGDNRVIGSTWRDLQPFCIDEADANVHVLIYGATKRGKTRVAEIIGLQAVERERAPVVVIDPKGDQAFRRRMQGAAKRAGVPFYCLDFADPEHSATYNPLGGYTDPSQVGDQVTQLCDHGEGGSYWRERAGNTARIVARAMDSVRRYLEACGGSAATPPPALKELEQKRGYSQLPEQFAPFGWYPRLSVLDIYGVASAHRLLGWMLRIVFAEQLDKAPDTLASADKAMIGKWWEAYLGQRDHPDDQHPERGPLLADIRVQMQRLRDLMDCEEDELAKANSSLFAAMERFRGRVSRITDAPNPDIVWERVAEQRAVVYFSLAAQEYSDLAVGFARIMCADLSAWCGKRSRLGRADPWYLIADEVDRWIPESFTDFLARGRSAGLRCIAIGQTRASFAARLGTHGREIIEGNTGTIVQFAAPGEVDAEAAAKCTGAVRIPLVRTSSTTSDAPQTRGQGDVDGHQTSNTTQSEDKDCDLFPAWAVRSLPIGAALVITQAGPAIIAFPELTDD